MPKKKKLANRDRPQNATYAVPIFNDLERALLDVAFYSRPCPQCGAKLGSMCKNKQNGESMLTSVHMGRLPRGFNTEKAVDELLTKLDL